jgi:hypothetical protein
MQALVAEVRQLRKDLETSNGNAVKAQILLYRLQVQEATVALVSQHLSDLRSRLAEMQRHLRDVQAFLKQSESLDNIHISPETSTPQRPRRIDGSRASLCTQFLEHWQPAPWRVLAVLEPQVACHFGERHADSELRS